MYRERLSGSEPIKGGSQTAQNHGPARKHRNPLPPGAFRTGRAGGVRLPISFTGISAPRRSLLHAPGPGLTRQPAFQFPELIGKQHQTVAQMLHLAHLQRLTALQGDQTFLDQIRPPVKPRHPRGWRHAATPSEPCPVPPTGIPPVLYSRNQYVLAAIRTVHRRSHERHLRENGVPALRTGKVDVVFHRATTMQTSVENGKRIVPKSPSRTPSPIRPRTDARRDSPAAPSVARPRPQLR